MVTRTIRVHRKDSAFVYAILESLEGMASYSTLPNATGADFRDLRLSIPPEFDHDILVILEGFRKKFPVVEIAGGQP